VADDFFALANRMADKNNYEHKESLAFAISMAASAFANHLVRKFREQKLDVTYEMWLILNSLWLKDGQSQNELAADCYRDKSAITRLIDNLIERNLIVRIQDRIDRRSNMIYLTKAGKDLKEKLIPIAENLLAEACQLTDTKEQEIAKKVLQQLFTNLN
jgi:DNA-binding MarR family transcriptional regulator